MKEVKGSNYSLGTKDHHQDYSLFTNHYSLTGSKVTLFKEDIQNSLIAKAW